MTQSLRKQLVPMNSHEKPREKYIKTLHSSIIDSTSSVDNRIKEILGEDFSDYEVYESTNDVVGEYTQEIVSELDKHLVGQQKAKLAIAEALVECVKGDRPEDGPLGVLFFHGPTGVGKTEIVKALGEVMLGNRRGFIKISCENFQDRYTASNIFGSPKGYIGYGDSLPFSNKNLTKAFDAAKGIQTTNQESHKKKIRELNETLRLGKANQSSQSRVKEKLNELEGDTSWRRIHPLISDLPWFSIVVLDEIEKAHEEVLQQLLGAFNDGRVTLSNGEESNLENTIFILTSNLGQKEMRELKSQKSIGFHNIDSHSTSDDNKKVFESHLQKKFTPEFLDRIHSFIEFEPLNNKMASEIIHQKLQKHNDYLKQYYQLSDISVVLDEHLINQMVDEMVQGGKSPRHVVRNLYKNIIAPSSLIRKSDDFLPLFQGGKVVIYAYKSADGKIQFKVLKQKSNLKKKSNKGKSKEDSQIPSLLLPNFKGINLDMLNEMNIIISRYLQIMELQFDEDFDLSEEIEELLGELAYMGLDERDLETLKTKACLDYLETYNFIDIFEGIDIDEKGRKQFHNLDSRIIERLIEKTFKEYQLESKSDTKFLIHATREAIRRIQRVTNIENLSLHQTKAIIFLVKKILLEKFNLRF